MSRIQRIIVFILFTILFTLISCKKNTFPVLKIEKESSIGWNKKEQIEA